MKKWNQRNIFILFLTLWFLLNLLQAIFTEITSDEAYYGLYGKYLSWGYFDHPPMIALLTHLSAILFSGNLGIRFMTVLLQIGTLLFTWKLLDSKQFSKTKTINFFIIAASLVMFSAYGFITTPDVPLLFFTAFFLYAYQSFLKENSFSASILLTVSMAGLVYSKYQAVLVIGFVVLSNLRLLTNYKFWLAGIVAIILLLPHFFWQFNNDFPSFKFHLVDRSSGFKWDYLMEYLPNQLVVFNPLTLALVIYVLYKYKAKSLFERAEYFLIIGFIIFFWLTALRGHVEPQWTVACSIPMILILVNRSLENIKLNNYILKFIAPSLLLILAIRILLITPLLPERLGFSGKMAKYKAIERIAGDKPVIFNWSFQDPSLYTFFTHKEAHVVSSLNSRQTQFDLWQFEQNYHDKPVFVCLHLDGKSKIYSDKDIQFEGFVCDNIQTTNRLIIKFEILKKTLQIGDSITLFVSISNPTKYPVNFNHPQFPVALNAVFIHGKNLNLQNVKLSESITNLKPNETLKRRIKTYVPVLPPDVYQFGFTLNTFFGQTLNSNLVKIKLQTND